MLIYVPAPFPTTICIDAKMAAQTARGVPLSTLSPRFLHSNSTSHTWPFSAIAELIDNAYDPDVSAKQFWIDKTVVGDQECLTFMDNGNGLDNETMHKMLSFGYSDKTPVEGVEPIGIYGNGFKSGSMRLGKDAIVFSKSKRALCVGMLSQTYLEKIKAKQISVPIVCFERSDSDELPVREEHKASLQDILSYSPFTTWEKLLDELNAIVPPMCTENTGTRIIIWNLRKTSTGGVEFDFEQDRYDIRIPSDLYDAMNIASQNPERVLSHIPESLYSLRAYCSILYLKPRMQINIRGLKVKSQLIAKSLAFVKKDYYKPNFLNKRVTITFGYNTKSKDQYGIMMYHKNRLIKGYERVGCQLKGNNQGVGVIGVIECNFLDPTHNKQSFMETDKYRRTMLNLATKLEDYWKEIRYRRSRDDPNNTTPVEDTIKQPDQNWVQCDDCLNWRKLPDGIDFSKLPDKWFCYLNPNPQFRSCKVAQEPVDSDDDQPSYRKTYKQQERENKKQQARKRQKVGEARRHQEDHYLDMSRQNDALRRQEQRLTRQLRQTTVHSPSTPTTPKTRSNTESLQGSAARAESSPLRSSTISQAACTPSSNSGLPVISSVCSLSPGLLRDKRVQSVTPQGTPKRPRVSYFQSGISATSSSVVMSPLCSPSVPAAAADDDDDTDDTDDTDDDIFIVESVSTTKPVKPEFDLSKIKTEQAQSDASVGMLLECSDDAAVDVTLETNTAGTSPSPAPLTELATTTTQTEVPKVKKEEDSQNHTEGEEQAGQSTSNKNDKEQSSHVDTDVCATEQRVIKQEGSGNTQNENPEIHHLQNGVTHHLENDKAAGSSCMDACNNRYSPRHHPSIAEVQKQQDQLLDLMQATAQERDTLQEQVLNLTRQLQDMQNRLQELSQISAKECSHQACQTEKAEETEARGVDYRSLFEKAKRKVNELINDKELLLAATENKPSISYSEKTDTDEIALQVDSLLRGLDQRTKERDGLRSQLDIVEEERASLVSQCEELRLSLQQQMESAPRGGTAPHQTTDASVSTDPEDAGGTVESGSDTSRSLVELRQNIGRLLVTFVPALDLAQVNFECNVIDEILEQYLCQQ